MEHFARWLRFNLWYLGRPPWDTGITPPEVVEFIQSVPPGRALDLGCGTGTNLSYLAKAGWQVTGVEYVLKAARSARSRLREAGLKGDVIVGDVSRLDPGLGNFQFVLDIGCFHSLEEGARRRYIDRLPGLLSPGGSYMIYAHTRREDASRIGIHPADIDALSARLRLAWRVDSQDRFGRGAVWMRFQP